MKINFFLPILSTMKTSPIVTPNEHKEKAVAGCGQKQIYVGTNYDDSCKDTVTS